jgi:predicted Zn-dependent protease
MAPKRSDIAVALALELMAFRYFQSAEAILAAALENDPRQPLLHAARGDLALERQEVAIAREHYQRAREADPRLLPATVGLARCLVLEQQPGQAVDLLREALEREPSNGPANAELGRLLMQQGDWNAALPKLEKARESDPGNARLAVDLARCYRRGGQARKGLAVLQSLRQPDTVDAAWRLELAQLYTILNRKAEAQAERMAAQQLEAMNQEGLRFVPPTVYIH